MIGMNGAKQADPEMNISSFEHRRHVDPDCFHELHLHVGTAFGVAVKEGGKHGFKDDRWGGHLQHPGAPAAEQLRSVGNGAHLTQEAAAFYQQLLALHGQEEPAPDAIEEFEAELALELADMA